MEELEAPKIDIIKPVTVKVRVSGKAKREDGKYLVKWFDNTIKVLDYPDFEFNPTTFVEGIQQVMGLYQLNSESILSVKISTI